ALRTTPPRSSQYGGTSVPPPQRLRRSGARARINISGLPLCGPGAGHLASSCAGRQLRRGLNPSIGVGDRLTDLIPRILLESDLLDPRSGVVEPTVELTVEVLLNGSGQIRGALPLDEESGGSLDHLRLECVQSCCNHGHAVAISQR